MGRDIERDPDQPLLGDLSGRDRKRLLDALVSAYYSREKLEMLLRLELNENINVIAGSTDLELTVFQLIKWAEAHGRLDDLITAATRMNPGNPELIRFKRDVWEPRQAARLPGIEGKTVRASDGRSRVDGATAAPTADRPASHAADGDQVFISYSRRDRRWLEQLQIFLKPYVRGGTIDVWDDTKILPGARWQDEIKSALARAKVAVLLVTPNFLASEFVARNELPAILEAAEKEGTTIFWIAVSASPYHETSIAHFQAANNPAAPLDLMSTARRNKEWVRICDLINEALDR